MNVKEYTPEEREKIKAKIIEELDKAFDVNRYGKGTPLWMNLLFLLRRFNKGNYYGTLELKVLGTSCNDIKEKERTFKLLELFPEP